MLKSKGSGEGNFQNRKILEAGLELAQKKLLRFTVHFNKELGTFYQISMPLKRGKEAKNVSRNIAVEIDTIQGQGMSSVRITIR